MEFKKEKESDRDSDCEEIDPKKSKDNDSSPFETSVKPIKYFDNDSVPETPKGDLIDKKSQKNKESVGMDELLTCGICRDIMYNCSSIQPCLHTFCGACLIDWIGSGKHCPMCRGPIDGVLKNHLMTDIINKYIEKHPDKEKPIDEREEADLKILNGQNILEKNIMSCQTYRLSCSKAPPHSPGECHAVMEGYYGRRGMYVCPTCRRAYTCEYSKFYEAHKHHLVRWGQRFNNPVFMKNMRAAMEPFQTNFPTFSSLFSTPASTTSPIASTSASRAVSFASTSASTASTSSSYPATHTFWPSSLDSQDRDFIQKFKEFLKWRHRERSELAIVISGQPHSPPTANETPSTSEESSAHSPSLTMTVSVETNPQVDSLRSPDPHSPREYRLLPLSPPAVPPTRQASNQVAADPRGRHMEAPSTSDEAGPSM